MTYDERCPNCGSAQSITELRDLNDFFGDPQEAFCLECLNQIYLEDSFDVSE